MRSRRSFSALRWLSLVLVLSGVVLFTLQLVRFSRLWAYFPQGLSIAGIPLGQMDRQQAANRLLEAFSIPVELHYEDALIQLNPSTVGFELDLESMLAVADLERTRQPFWTALWNFLWGSQGRSVEVPLRASLSEERLRTFLVQEVALRYDRPPTPPMPDPETGELQPGKPGSELDIERSIILIEIALRSPSLRIVDLPIQNSTPSRPVFQSLDIFLKQTIDRSEFDGLLGLYLLDLQTAQEISFLYQNGRTLPNQPELAFTAGNTIKIPIMISVFRRVTEETDPQVFETLDEMMIKTGNTPADRLMEMVFKSDKGPLEITDDLRAMGLQNTFLAGYFYTGAPLLAQIRTPANEGDEGLIERSPYHQTTPSEMGMLLADMYHCSQNGGGSLLAIFPDEIDPLKCQAMIDYLLAPFDRRIEVLLAGGLPAGTKIAHKNGWTTDAQGLIHDMSDAALVYTPGGNYILVVFMYHANQIVWEPASLLFADLSRAVYDFYNYPAP